MKKEFWVVLVTYEDGTVNVSQEIYNKYENARSFVRSRGGNLKTLGDFITYDTENGIEYKIKGVELGD